MRWFVTTARIAALRTLSDAGGLVMTVVFYVIVVSAIGTVWRVAAAAEGGQVVGYGAAALTWYVLATEAAVVPLEMRMIEHVGDDIAGGAVAAELLRPVPMLGVRVAAALGRALPRLAACCLAALVVGQVTVGGPPDLAGVALAVPALVLALTCNILAQHAFAAASFWVRDARSAWFLYQKLVFVLGGMLLPLQVLPGWLQGVAEALPFMAMAYVPGRLASGHVEPGLLAVQAGWVAVTALVAALAFGAGERRLQVVGG